MMQISMKPLDEANGGKHILVKRTPTEMIHVVEHDKPTRKRPNTVNSYKWDGDLLVVDGHCSFIGKYPVKELVACANAIRDAQAAAAFI